MKDDRIVLSAYWKNRRITAREYINACYEFLARLREFSEAFASRCVVIGRTPIILSSELDRFREILSQAIEDPESAYGNPDPSNQSLTPDSTSTLGFRVSFSDPDSKATANTAIGVSVTAGAYSSYSPVAPPQKSAGDHLAYIGSRFARILDGNGG